MIKEILIIIDNAIFNYTEFVKQTINMRCLCIWLN